MKTITITPLDSGCPQDTQFSVRGETIGAALVAFIEHMRDAFGSEVMEQQGVKDAIAAVANGELVFEYRDFSCPEDQFNLTVSDDTNRIALIVAAVVECLKKMGVDATHEYQDTIHIERDEQWCWVFGTINEQWDGNLCCDGDAQQTVVLPFRSDDVGVDPHQIAELISFATAENEVGHRVFEIDGSEWRGTTAQFINSNNLAAPEEILSVMRLGVGETCTIGGGAAAQVSITRK